MKNTAMAEAYIRQAMERLKHAGEALRRGNYPYVVRQSQEAVELALRASLRLVGVEPPRWYDVGPVLRREAERFPEWFRDESPRLARISRRLRREREPSMYGDEESGIPPDELYDMWDVLEALRWARFTLRIVRRLFVELTGFDVRV